ncbi:MAG: hypothetical protein NTV06_06550, partial [candidate division Zixibacteria bacterium]|nr:hypothetical protein [candidate division Zixibacteria bacterium]
MKRFSNSLCLVMLLSFSSVLYGWENRFTHPAITEQAVDSNAAQINDYLKNQLGLSSGLSTQLYWNFPSDVTNRIRAGSADAGNRTRTVLEWIRTGSNIEDMDGIRIVSWRSRHHFHDPYRNAGLDNHFDHPDWTAPFWSSWLPLGQSALEWAITGTAVQEPTTNNNRWEDARDAFYDALTKSSKPVRDANLAMTFLDLGCVLHMLEDMGVPAHTRNDFLFGHYRTWRNYGNPLETWVEQEVIANHERLPDRFLNGWTSQPRVFSNLRDYFDPDKYTGQYLGDSQLPPSDWGLAECTNYQFLSESTIFKADVNN